MNTLKGPIEEEVVSELSIPHALFFRVGRDRGLPRTTEHAFSDRSHEAACGETVGHIRYSCRGMHRDLAIIVLDTLLDGCDACRDALIAGLPHKTYNRLPPRTREESTGEWIDRVVRGGA